MAAYQAADTLPEAIDSALAQTRPPLEVIVCDDGSTDRTGAALARYGERIRVVRQPNRGFAAARNTAAWNARGEFAVFLDADDAYLPERLEALGDLAAARPDLDIVSTDAYTEQEDARSRLSRVAPFPLERQTVAMAERCFLHAPAVRLRSLIAVGGFDERLRVAADVDCWLRLLLAGARVGCVAEPLAVYRLRPGSLSADRAPTLRERALLLERARDHPGFSAEERDWLGRRLVAHRARALVAEAHDAVARGDRTARRRLLRVATARGIGPADRARAAAMLAAPRRARRWTQAELARPRYVDPEAAGPGPPPPAAP